MNYGTAAHGSGHIIGYAQWGFTEFLVSEDIPGTVASVTPTSGTDRNFTRWDSELVSLMGPEAELMVCDDHDEYIKGAQQDWVDVFGNFPTTEHEVINIQCDNRVYTAQYYLGEHWEQLINIADRIANGERVIQVVDA
jgi:hypothetical protein